MIEGAREAQDAPSSRWDHAAPVGAPLVDLDPLIRAGDPYGTLRFTSPQTLPGYCEDSESGVFTCGAYARVSDDKSTDFFEAS